MKQALLITVLLLAACARPEDDANVKPTATVTTVMAAPGTAEETVVAYGTAEFAPDAERTLVAPVEASLARLLAPAGSRVAAGQPVAVLAASPTSALDLGKARNDAAAADAALARARRLRASGLAGDADVEAATSAAATADQTFRSLHTRSGGSITLTAPMAGVVESVAVDAGATAAQGAPVIRIGALTGLRVRLGLEPDRAARVRVGEPVRLTPLAGGVTASGVVSLVDPRVDAQTRLASLFARAPAGGFAPGESLKGEIILGRRMGVILVPRAAVVFDGDEPAVFVVGGGAAHRRKVGLGIESVNAVEVTSGLAAGDRVVVGGVAALEDGMAVREAAPDAEARPAGADGPR